MDTEKGKPTRPSANMFIELSELTPGAPRNWRPEQEYVRTPSRYWHERFRWIEMEEAFDEVVGLVFKAADYATVEEAFDRLPPICPTTDEVQMSDTRGGYRIPFYHPQATSQSIMHRRLSGLDKQGHDKVSSAYVNIVLYPYREFRQACEKAVSKDEVYAVCKQQLSNWIFQGEEIDRGRRSSASEESDPFEEVEVLDEDDSESVAFKDQLKTVPGRCFHRMCPPLRDLAFGLVAVVKRYASDYKDAFVNGNASVAFGSILFIYFVIFSPAITFGTLMSTQVNPAYSVSNSILTSGFQTIIYSLFAGQPIAIIGPSGPGFIMEKLVAREATQINMDYWCFRSWVLIYAIIMGFILMSLNLSELAMHAKKSMEELFSAFISGFLIIKAMFSLLSNIPQTLPKLENPLSPTAAGIWEAAAKCGVDNFLALLMVCFAMTIVKFKTSHLVRRRVCAYFGYDILLP
ncbi:unnamed protein product [Dibothriocephalus latus]|uniref:Bicarbonate transporter-like transmembrane domain-containing protein n=1 Tax=Dibothriocephalus latus TaxID=60516 RepID=A0A3P6SWD2_DIBLA|nr:unnamed protein product [Dibothriocephalus latus]